MLWFLKLTTMAWTQCQEWCTLILLILETDSNILESILVSSTLFCHRRLCIIWSHFATQIRTPSINPISSLCCICLFGMNTTYKWHYLHQNQIHHKEFLRNRNESKNREKSEVMVQNFPRKLTSNEAKPVVHIMKNNTLKYKAVNFWPLPAY